ncbi:hypothetical protein [Undibacterium crateris]|uniref:hypothetical protein n=1 Tax=Undibacterium crateris TaxID=2528175 RepID=UPI001389ABD9|nr:hypothetical protein [Undibacterium crateris]NDI86051.1 hypothetical protein [Undibacterium crateris]
MKHSLTRPFDAYFPEIEIGEVDPSLIGYVAINVSLFDHWLTEEEADASKSLCYGTAVIAGAMDEYLVGERKFLDFYNSLAVGGVICNRPAPLRLMNANDPKFCEIVVASLREKKSMDVYFSSANVRIIGRYDRTDLALLERATDLATFAAKVRGAGLFILT